MTRNDHSFNVPLSNMPEPSEDNEAHISSLNVVCLEAIFKNFSFPELLHFRLVCPYWKRCIEILFARTHVIELFVNKTEYKRFIVSMRVRYFDPGKYYLFNSRPKAVFILRPKINPIFIVESLLKLFPNIKRLMLQRCNDIYQNGITQLIQKCSSLIEVSFGHMPANDHIDSQFWTVLNNATQIRSVMFINLYKTILPDELSILKRIHSFHLSHYRFSLVPILGHLGPNCWRIFLTWVYLTSEELEYIVEVNATLKTSITSLRLEYIASYENRESNYKRLIETFVKHFKSIEHLDICFGDHLDFPFLFTNFHCLPHLKKLFLYFGSSQIPRKEQINREIHPLLTLKSLVLESYKLSGDELLFWIPLMFPNLEQLNIHSEPPDWLVDVTTIKDSFFVSLSKLKYFNIKVG